MNDRESVIKNALEVAREEIAAMAQEVYQDLYGTPDPTLDTPINRALAGNPTTPFGVFSLWLSEYLDAHPGEHGKFAAIEVSSFFVAVAILKAEGRADEVLPVLLNQAFAKYNGAVAASCEEEE